MNAILTCGLPCICTEIIYFYFKLTMIILLISFAAAQPNVYLDLSVSAYPPLSPRSPNATSPTFVSFDPNQTSFNF